MLKYLICAWPARARLQLKTRVFKDLREFRGMRLFCRRAAQTIYVNVCVNHVFCSASSGTAWAGHITVDNIEMGESPTWPELTDSLRRTWVRGGCRRTRTRKEWACVCLSNGLAPGGSQEMDDVITTCHFFLPSSVKVFYMSLLPFALFYGCFLCLSASQWLLSKG